MKSILLLIILTSGNLLARTTHQAETQGYRLLGEFAKTKNSEFGCFPCSVGGGFLDNKVNNLTLDLCFSREAAVDEARVLYVNLLLDLIDFVAKDTSVQPYLRHTPPSTKEISFHVSFSGANGVATPPNGKVCYTLINSKGDLVFCTDPRSKTGYEDLHRELFFEAIEIVRKAGKLNWYPWLNEWLVREKKLLESGS